MKTQKGAVDLTVGPIRIYSNVDRTGDSRAVNELLKAQKAFGAMYSMIIAIMMRHSAKRRILRLSISPTSLRREVANRLYQQRAFRPDFSGGLLRGCLYSSYCAVFCQFHEMQTVDSINAELENLLKLMVPETAAAANTKK